MSSGAVQIFDFSQGIQLTMWPELKKAAITYRSDKYEDVELYNYFKWMAELYKTHLDRRGTEIVDGVKTDLYVSDGNPHSIQKIWTDPDLDLPVRTTNISSPHPDTTVISPVLYLQKSSFGSEKNESRMVGLSSNTGITRKMTTTKHDFVWNSDLDEALFNVRPPAGYSVDEDSLDTSETDRMDVLDALRQWTAISGGRFPDDINDLVDQESTEPLLVKAFDGDGDPEEEFDLAMAAANILVRGCYFAQEMKVEGTWHYSGKGVMLGDSNAPICWWKETGSDKYRIIYGDLRVEDIEEKDLPGKK
jgi:hypothetical protein